MNEISLTGKLENFSNEHKDILQELLDVVSLQYNIIILNNLILHLNSLKKTDKKNRHIYNDLKYYYNNLIVESQKKLKELDN